MHSMMPNFKEYTDTLQIICPGIRVLCAQVQCSRHIFCPFVTPFVPLLDLCGAVRDISVDCYITILHLPVTIYSCIATCTCTTVTSSYMYYSVLSPLTRSFQNKLATSGVPRLLDYISWVTPASAISFATNKLGIVSYQ